MSKKIKNTKKSFKKIIIMILVILLVIILILLAKSLSKPKVIREAENEKIDMYDIDAAAREYLKDKVIPQHIYDFSKEYKGSVDRNVLYERLYTVSRYLPDLCSDLKIVDAKDYYAKFSKQIKEYLGIGTESEFLKLASYLKENDVSELEFEYCAYISGSIVPADSKYYKMQINFKYETKDEITLGFKIATKQPASYTLVKVSMD